MNQQVAKVIQLQNDNMRRVGAMPKAVDRVNISHNGKKSVEYAKCRAAINEDCNTLYKDNAAGAKNFKVDRKKHIIEFLGGKIQWNDTEDGRKKFVMFPDGSQARY